MCVLIIVENMSGFVCSNFKPAHNIFKTTSGENLAEGYVLPILKKLSINSQILDSEDVCEPLKNLNKHNKRAFTN